jgi:hypothetical protein
MKASRTRFLVFRAMLAAFFPELPAQPHPTRRSVGDEQSPPDTGDLDSFA